MLIRKIGKAGPDAAGGSDDDPNVKFAGVASKESKKPGDSDAGSGRRLVAIKKLVEAGEIGVEVESPEFVDAFRRYLGDGVLWMEPVQVFGKMHFSDCNMI